MARSEVAPRRKTAARTASSITTPPIWRESLWPVDWLNLHMSPVYYGVGVPRGDGSPVVLVPGFLGTDAYLLELYLWLERIGYKPYMSGIGVNAECPGPLTRRLLTTVKKANTETGRRVRIIGHSLGGILGRRACLQRPELTSQLIYLGSPVQGLRAHPAVLATVSLLKLARSVISVKMADCLTESCGCGFGKDMAKPLDKSVHHAAIYTHSDGVVDWHDAQERDPKLNHEVGGTHVGLVYNPRAYAALGQLLAEG